MPNLHDGSAGTLIGAFEATRCVAAQAFPTGCRASTIHLYADGASKPVRRTISAHMMSPLSPPPLTLLDKYFWPDFQALYSTTVTVNGGEAGHGRASGTVRSDDGQLDLDLRLPEQLGGPGGGTNPEQLFAAAYGACFHGALSLLAAKTEIAIVDAKVEVTIHFGRDPVDGLFNLVAQVRVHLPGVEPGIAEELVRNTERFCPYAKMAREGIVSVVALAQPNRAAKP
jgi:osmotically inducible protein OsmC